MGELFKLIHHIKKAHPDYLLHSNKDRAALYRDDIAYAEEPQIYLGQQLALTILQVHPDG